MEDFDIDCLLRKNAKASRHAESIKKTLNVVRQLREAGVAGHGGGPLPYQGRPTLDNIPKPPNRRLVKGPTKLGRLLER